MDKLELITKEIKELKIYLSNLYSEKKENELNNACEKTQKYLDEEINAITYVIDTLKTLKDKFINGVGEKELLSVTTDNDNNYNNYLSLYPEGIPTSFHLPYIKVARLKESLDNINEIFLSKTEIYEYLNNYNQVMRLARKYHTTSLWHIFLTYMKITNPDNANFAYYEKMIKLHMLYDNLMLLSIIKDEDFTEIDATDDEMSEKDKNHGLAFLKTCFLNPNDATRFKKHHIFNFVRNAVFHNDINELYKVSANCENIFINLKMTNPIPFRFKIHNFGIYNMLTYISEYSHHAPTFIIKNQSSMNLANLTKNYNRRMRELNKLILTRLSLTEKSSDNKGTILDKMYQNKTLFSHQDTINILNNYSSITELEYPFTKEQKDLFSKKIELFMDITKNDLKFFIAPILYNYMQGGIYKYNFYKYDFLINQLYLLDSDNSLDNVTMDILSDFNTLLHKHKIAKNKNSVFNYIKDDVDYSKGIVLYLNDKEIREDMNDAILFTYALCSLNDQTEFEIDGVTYELEHIRNAFTHGRWLCNHDGDDKYYSLYDDEDLLIDPANSKWQGKYSYQELMKLCNSLKNNYILKTNSKIKVKSKQ